MAQTLKSGVKLVQLRPILGTILLISLVFGLFSEGYDRLWTPHLLDNFTFPDLFGLDSVVWFGLISVVGTLLSLALNEGMRGLVARLQKVRQGHPVLMVLMALSSLLMIVLVVFGLTRSFAMALMMILAVKIIRQAIFPLHMAWINRNTTSNVRATVLSIKSQANALGQIGGGPAVGALATFSSLRLAFIACAVIVSPVLALYFRAMGQEQARDALADSAA